MTGSGQANTGSAFTCPRCGAVSHHPVDRQQGYCGRCHDWTVPGQQALFAPRPECPAHGGPMIHDAGRELSYCPGWDGEGCDTPPVPDAALDWRALGTVDPGDIL